MGHSKSKQATWPRRKNEGECACVSRFNLKKKEIEIVLIKKIKQTQSICPSILQLLSLQDAMCQAASSSPPLFPTLIRKSPHVPPLREKIGEGLKESEAEEKWRLRGPHPWATHSAIYVLAQDHKQNGHGHKRVQCQIVMRALRQRAELQCAGLEGGAGLISTLAPVEERAREAVWDAHRTAGEKKKNYLAFWITPRMRVLGKWPVK